MSIFDNDEPFKSEKLTADAIADASIITKKLEIDDINYDIDNDEVEMADILKAVFNPKSTHFIDLNKGKGIKVRVELENGTVKTYEINALISWIKHYIDVQTYEQLDGIVLYYMSNFYPEIQLPDGAMDKGEEAIRTAKKMVDGSTDYTISKKDMVINSEEERAEVRKRVAESYISDAFINAILILKTFEDSCKGIRNKEIVQDIKQYVKKYNEFCMKMIGYCGQANPKVRFQCLADVFSTFSSEYTEVARQLGLHILSDEDVISFIEDYMTREEFESFIRNNGEVLLDRSKVMKFVTAKTPMHDHSKAGMFSIDELKQMISTERAKDTYNYSMNKDVLEFMAPEQVIEAYFEDWIDDRTLRKYVTLKDVLNSSIDAEKKMKILLGTENVKPFYGRESEKIWSLYESGEFTIDDIRKIEKIGYFRIDDIVGIYVDNSKRAIANELEELPVISEEKLFKYFTPEEVLNASSNNKKPEHNVFYNTMIKEIYISQGHDLEEEIAKTLKEKSGLNKSSLATEAFLLYRDGITSIDILKKLEIASDDIVNYCKKHKDDTKLLIDVFNAGLVENLTMFEEVLDTDFDLACELIRKGMSARIIQGFETTKALIQMTRPSVDEDGNEIPPVLTYDHLAELKEDIDIGLDNEKNKSKTNPSTILDLYLSDKLSYSELYGMAEAGVFSIDVANEINEKYSLIKDWKALKEKGVEGSPIEGLYDNINPDPTPEPGISRSVVGIDEECIIDFYIALGATEYLEIDAKKCPVFKDYIVIPVMDKKVAYLEGKEARTYIVPLKIVLEQINNPNGEMDLIGNAQSRNAFNSQKKHIRSANHSRNWGRKVVMKTAELPSVPMNREDAKKFIEDNMDIIKAIENSYDSRKYAKTDIE